MDRRPHPTTILRWTVDGAILLLVALVVVGVGLGRVVPLTGRQTLIIAGPSMEPSIPMGSAVIVEPFGATGPSVGDVVTIRLGPTTSFVTHRVVRLLTLSGVPYLEMKGDANPAPDPATVPAASVVGRVAWSVPFAGFLLALLSVPVGIAFVLVLGLTLVIAAYLLDTFDGVLTRPIGAARPATSTKAGAGLVPDDGRPEGPDPTVGPGAVLAPVGDRRPAEAPAPGRSARRPARATRPSDPGGPALEGRVARHLASRPPASRRRRPA